MMIRPEPLIHLLPSRAMVFAVLVFLTGCSMQNVLEGPQIGELAPDFEFIALADRNPKQFSIFLGKVVVLDFWATWCPPCQQAMANMQTYPDKHPEWGDRVLLMSLSLDDSMETVIRHLEQKQWYGTFNAWAGDKGWSSSAPQAYGITGIPTTYIVDQKGQVAAKGHPIRLNIPQEIERLLAVESAALASP